MNARPLMNNARRYPGGAAATNVRYALSELPVIIIDSSVLLNKICTSRTMWGFGSAERSHFAVFRRSYEPHERTYFTDYYGGPADKMLLYLKCVLGYTYDVHNSARYDRLPLLPRVADYEYGTPGGGGCLSGEPARRDAICETCREFYSMMMGDSASDGGESFAKGSANYKGCILHKLRMEYVDVMRGYLPDRQYLRYLNDSMEARQARAAGRRHNMRHLPLWFCASGQLGGNRKMQGGKRQISKGAANMPPLL